MAATPSAQDPFLWAARPLEDLMEELSTTSQGLREDEAQSRFETIGPNEPARRRKRGLLYGFLVRFLDPLVIVLLVIGGFSLFFGEKVSAALVAGMALISVGLSFAQEFRADRAAEKLTALVRVSATALRMSKQEVIVKRLSSPQNLGAMNVFCTDKTGTLTMDEVVLERHCDVVLQENEAVLSLAYLNSVHQTGLKNLLDRAILNHHEEVNVLGEKVDEIPTPVRGKS